MLYRKIEFFPFILCQVYKFIILNLKHEKNCFSLTIIIAVKCLATFQVCEWTACWAGRNSHIASERRVCCWQHFDSSKCFATCARGSRRIFTKKKSNSVIKRNSCASVGSRKLRVSSLPSSDSGSRLSLFLSFSFACSTALSREFSFVSFSTRDQQQQQLVRNETKPKTIKVCKFENRQMK